MIQIFRSITKTIEIFMKKIYSLFTIVILTCILFVTYSCKTESTEKYNFTQNYIKNGKPDIMSFIVDLKEAGCYEEHSVIVNRYYHSRIYRIKFNIPNELEIPENFTNVLKNSKDPIQIAKVKDAIEKAKNIHEEKVEKFNKACQLLMHGFNQLKSKAKDSLLLSNKDTLAIAIRFDTIPDWGINNPDITFKLGKLQQWVYGKKDAIFAYIVKGDKENSIIFGYNSMIREDDDKVVFCEPDTALMEHTMLDYINTRKVRSTDVNYEYSNVGSCYGNYTTNYEGNKDDVFAILRRPQYKSSKSVGKLFFVPLTQNEKKDFVSKLHRKLDNVAISQHYTNLWFYMNDAYLDDGVCFHLYTQYYEGGMPPIHKNADDNYDRKAIDKLRNYILYAYITSDGLYILRLNSTQSVYVPYDWMHIKKCVDFNYEYCDLTKEGA
jgi:hypothetical protein